MPNMTQRILTVDTVPAPAPTNYYVWSFPGSVTVHLSLDVVTRLAAQLTLRPEGLLLGNSNAAVTEITDFKILSASEVLALHDKAAFPPIPSGIRAVGYFRVQRDGELRLNPADLALVKAAFSNPADVFLVVQSGAEGTKASFFFWDGDQMYGDFAFLEFPFDASLLPGRKPRRIEGAPEKSPAVKTEQTPPLPPLQTARSGRTRWTEKMLVMFGAIFLGALVGIFAALRFLPAISPKASPSAARPFASIGLNVDRRPDGYLKVTWNRENLAVVTASTGTMLVQDGAAQRKIILDKQLLHTGSLLYSPASDQVQMSLVIEGPETATETVVVISKGPNVRQP